MAVKKVANTAVNGKLPLAVGHPTPRQPLKKVSAIAYKAAL